MKSNTAKQQQQTAAIYARVSSEEQVQGYSIQEKENSVALGPACF